MGSAMESSELEHAGTRELGRSRGVALALALGGASMEAKSGSNPRRATVLLQVKYSVQAGDHDWEFLFSTSSTD